MLSFAAQFSSRPALLLLLLCGQPFFVPLPYAFNPSVFRISRQFSMPMNTGRFPGVVWDLWAEGLPRQTLSQPIRHVLTFMIVPRSNPTPVGVDSIIENISL